MIDQWFLGDGSSGYLYLPLSVCNMHVDDITDDYYIDDYYFY